MTRLMLRIDSREFGDPEHRDAAVRRFFQRFLQTPSDINMCAEMAIDAARRGECLRANDFDCLSRLAKEIEEHIGSSFRHDR